ncbi:MAG: hypothetical protein L0Y54_16935 [Sporichthyaceae bacterium]|nr:hypothetical protein [Sporichthyaceae bacterium]
MTFVIDAVVPLASVLVGAGLTYWLNVHQRHQTAIDNIFAGAIAAVAVAAAAKHYQPRILRGDYMTEDEHRAFQAWHERTTLETYIRSTAEARAAVAKAAPYAQQLATYYENPSAVGERPAEVIAALLDARDTWRRKHGGRLTRRR